MVDSAAELADSDVDYEEDNYESNLEIEGEDPAENIIDPFDPERIRIRTTTVLIQQLVSRISYEEIDLTPDFQRLRNIWNPQRKSRLIESLLLKIPIPVFYVAADDQDDWSVVDGVQRMSTINDYVTGEFNLQRLEYLTQFNGLAHSELPRGMQRRISETELVVNVIEPGTPAEVMFNVFLRINTGGMRLNGQEIRHAIHPGPVRSYLRHLAETEEFMEATGRTINPKRMDDRECVLRFLAFHTKSWEKYDPGRLDVYLGQTMERINKMPPRRRRRLTRDFKKAMCAAHAIFGENAFRKPSTRKAGRSKISRALFEVWSVQLARCSEAELEELIAQRREIKKRFKRLIEEDDDFDRSISSSTGTTWRVHKRFEAIEELVREFV